MRCVINLSIGDKISCLYFSISDSGELFNMENRKSIRLSDYVEYPFLIPSIFLDFDIRKDFVFVKSTIIIKNLDFAFNFLINLKIFSSLSSPI